MNDLLAYRQNTRNSGRTTRLIKAIPQGGYYVVRHSNMIPIVNNYLKQIGREREITPVSINSHYWMRGRRNVIVGIDHFVFESASPEEIAVMYQGLIPCGSMVMTNDYEGDVMTTLHNFGPVGYTISETSPIEYPLTPLVEPTIESKFKALFGRFWPL